MRRNLRDDDSYGNPEHSSVQRNHIASCKVVTRAAPKRTGEPVELTCMSCANSTLFVFV
jgi:hypothetical protein